MPPVHQRCSLHSHDIISLPSATFCRTLAGHIRMDQYSQQPFRCTEEHHPDTTRQSACHQDCPRCWQHALHRVCCPVCGRSHNCLSQALVHSYSWQRLALAAYLSVQVHQKLSLAVKPLQIQGAGCCCLTVPPYPRQRRLSGRGASWRPFA